MIAHVIEIAVMLSPNTPTIGALITTWPTSVIDTQSLKSQCPVRCQRKRVCRYDQSSLRGMSSA